jgi:hypothetical protein
MGGYKAGLKTVLITGTGMTADELAKGKTISELIQENKIAPDYLLKQLM